MRTTVELTPAIAFGRGHTGYLLRPSRALDGLTILCDSNKSLILLDKFVPKYEALYITPHSSASPLRPKD